MSRRENFKIGELILYKELLADIKLVKDHWKIGRIKMFSGAITKIYNGELTIREKKIENNRLIEILFGEENGR